jgi:predicted Zn-dependent protease
MAIITALVHPAGGSPWLSVLTAAAPLVVYGAAQFALARHLRARRKSAQVPDRDARFREALVAYVQGRLDESETACRELLRADPDDVEATLQLASIARRRNAPRLAKRHLARARYLDDAGRWDFEIERELAALAGEAGRGA